MSLEDPVDKRVADLAMLVRDFPVSGFHFTDLSRILERDPQLFSLLADRLCANASANPPHAVLAVEARGLIYGAIVAHSLQARLILARKHDRLPGPTISRTYDSGYEQGIRLSVHREAVHAGDRILIVDDVLASGATALAVIQLLRGVGADITGFSVAVELLHLAGRRAVSAANLPVFAAARMDANWLK